MNARLPAFLFGALLLDAAAGSAFSQPAQNPANQVAPGPAGSAIPQLPVEPVEGGGGPAPVGPFGYAAKRPVIGGACPGCPWGALADKVQEAMKPHAPPTADDHAHTNKITLAIVVVYVVVWLPIGAVWTALNAYGLHRDRRWARTSTKIYAVTAIPTCLWTPFGIYALATLRKK